MARAIFVSNRLPITAVTENGDLRVTRSVGGLATALSGAKKASEAIWVGWPGPAAELGQADQARLDARLEELSCVPVPLKAREVREYYEDVSNGILWPLFHYQADRLPLEPAHWDTYAAVNERFADVVAAQWRAGDDIWVHDYQLLLVPALLRRRLPSARIGFFLHIPFPATELFRILPWRREVLEGMLGADLVGLHTESYAGHFRDAAVLLAGADDDGEQLRFEGRSIRVGAYPLGVDAREFAELSARESVRDLVAQLRGSGRERIIVGVDRLDYTKGIPRRLLAFRRMLEDNPDLHGAVRLIQLVVPSRTGVRTYREFRHRLDALVGEINGAFGSPAWTPVTYQYRSLPREELVALYAAADVMFVTPLRDGMNLVAKEFVATRDNEDGVLVLSEFAGAAEQLPEAVLINPYDVEGTAHALERALTMPREEQRVRMRALRRRVFAADPVQWARRFLNHLRSARRGSGRDELPIAHTGPDALARLAARARHAAQRMLFLDYDGTLVRFTNVPARARPDADLLDLLRTLAADPGTEVHIVSGRSRKELDQWLGELPVGLHAEHGLWSREPDEGAWAQRALEREPPYERLLGLMRRHSERVPGTLVEQKTAGLAWHFRMAEDTAGRDAARRLAREINPIADAHDLEILHGNKVLEVRPRGVHKGVIATDRIAAAAGERFVLAMGDDRTDEDLFAALPEGGVSVHVGPTPSRARYRLADVTAARHFLRDILRETPIRDR